MTRIGTWVRRAALLGLAAAGLTWGSLPAAEAAGLGSTRLTVDFRKAKEAAQQARWDHMDIIRCAPAGLGWGGEKREDRRTFHPATVRTIVPMGIGSSWRPTRNADVRVKLTWTGPHADQEIGHLYVRYGCDGEHWSEWRTVPRVRDEKPQAVKEFRTELRVRGAARTRYDELLAEYAKQDVTWKSDEEAAVTWLLEKEPGFFERQRPFIGYLEFLYETEFGGGTYLTSLEANVGWVLPGPHYAPKEKEARRGREGPWRWKSDYSHESEKPAFDRQAETKAVYEAVLRYVIAERNKPNSWRPIERLVVIDRTTGAPGLLRGKPLLQFDRRYRPSLPGLSVDVWEDWERSSVRTRWIPADLDVGLPVVLLSWRRLEQVTAGPPKDSAWDKFRARWPKATGYHDLTPVGFDMRAKGDPLALIHIGHQWDFLKGAGTLYLLTKKLGRWSVTASTMTWVS